MIDENHKFHQTGFFLSFSKDLAPKYLLPSEKAEIDATMPSSGWQVVGYNDFLTIDKFDRLLEIGAMQDDLVAWRPSTKLVLLPYAKTDLALQDVLDNSAERDETSPCLLGIVELRLSRACACHKDESSNGFERIIQALHLYFEKKGLFGGNSIVCSSLGAADIAIISFMSSPTDLAAHHELFVGLRCLKHSDIASLLPEKKGLFDKLSGHVFASANSTLAIHSEAREIYSSPQFKEAEIESGVTYSFRARVDCGHEEFFQLMVDSTCDSVHFSGTDVGANKFNTRWDSFAVAGSFDHLSDLITAWNKLWFDQRHVWRQANIVETITSVELVQTKDDVEQSQELKEYSNNWELNSVAWSELRKIELELKEFSAEFAGEVQQRELMECFNSFLTCFFRAELLGSAKDLLPFFRGLAMLFSKENRRLWSAYLVPESQKREQLERAIVHSSEFTDDFRYLVAHLSRCVRNRIEHRSQQGDLPIPHTLNFGACKLVNAYSVAFTLAIELFGRNPLSSNPPLFLKYTTSVGAGVDGVLMCDEYFSDFRDFVSSEYSDESPLRKSPRLLGLDISGNTVLDPSLCFVHCLHEVAEVSDWIQEPRNGHLLQSINRWLLVEIQEIMQNEIALKFCRQTIVDFDITDEPQNEPEQVEEHRKQFFQIRASLHEFVDCMTQYSLNQLHLEQESEKESELGTSGPAPLNLKQVIMKACTDYSPVEWVDVVSQELRKSISDFSTTENGIAELFPDIEFPTAAKSVGALLGDGFAESCAHQKELAREIVADSGMWLALNHLCSTMLESEEQEPTINDKLDWLCRAFEGIIMAADSKTGRVGNVRLMGSIVQRWCIQVASLLVEKQTGDTDSANPRPAPDWRGAIVAYVESSASLQKIVDTGVDFKSLVSNAAGFPRIYDPTSGLVANLAGMRGYGGSDENVNCNSEFVSVESLDQMKSAALRQFVICWKSKRSIDEYKLISVLASLSEVDGDLDLLTSS